ANFAGLLHMIMHSLTKSAIFFSVGHIAQVKGTQKMADIRGLTVSHPVLGWGLVLGVVAIVGLPPTGIFMSEFLILASTFGRAPDRRGGSALAARCREPRGLAAGGELAFSRAMDAARSLGRARAGPHGADRRRRIRRAQRRVRRQALSFGRAIASAGHSPRA